MALALAAGVLPAHSHDSLTHEIADVTEAIESGNAAAADYLRRGELYRLEHEWKHALADYDRAARMDPSLRAGELCRGALYLDRGQASRARETLDRFLADDSSSVEGLRLSAECWQALDRPERAVRDYDRMIERLERPTPDHYLARAQAVMACGPDHVDEAVRGIDRGIERLGPLVSLEFHAIDLELERENYDGALARLDRVAPQFGRPETVLERRGRILMAAGRPHEARQAFADALAAIERTPPGRRSLALGEMEKRIQRALAGGTPDSAAGAGADSHP